MALVQSLAAQSSLPLFAVSVAPLGYLDSGRGGGIRTPIPGFGDRSPSRWTTPLISVPALRPREDELLLHFFVRRLTAACIAELLGFHPFCVLLLVLRRRVVAVFAFAALQRNNLSHDLNPSFKALPLG